MNLYEFVTSTDVVAYWLEKNVNRTPLLGETLFPYMREIGVKLEWVKGANNQPVALRLSAYDAKAIRRDRQGIESYETKMPFFKESMYIDEEMRQNLNTLIQTNNMALIESILSKIFADQAKLIESAYIALERMRMEALTTGTITMASNGQGYTYDYLMPSENKVTVTTSWSSADADIIGDIEDLKATFKAKGVTLTRAICNSSVAKYFRTNTAIKNAIYVFAGGTVNVTSDRAIEFIFNETGVRVLVDDDVYVNEAGAAVKYVPDNKLIVIPEGILGNTHLGTTPEESDLLNAIGTDVTVTAEGIAFTTARETDPVTVSQKVSMVALPSFERIDEVAILTTVVTSA